MKFANFRARGLRNRCEPCGCRPRSHFFMLDDGSVYNVDTAGTIWYQAVDSLQWSPLYRCRNYIPWSGAVSRLDHVLRNEQGFSDNAQFSLRVPCGRPMSGGFIGFQTDTNSCVLFLNGTIVYEGEYRSDCDGQLTFNNQYGTDYFDYTSDAYYNYLTETNCNNNEPGGNDTPLYRNGDGWWNIDESTGEWTHTPVKLFETGHITPTFNMSVVSDTYSAPARDTFGWGLAVFPQDCCGNTPGLDYETGMHLGTNETGSLVWFTVKKRGAKWWRFAGQAASVDDLPDILTQKDWRVVDEYGVPQLFPEQ